MPLLLLFFIFIVNITPALAQPDISSAASFNGRSVNALTNSWGSPDIRMTRSNGNTVLVYQIQTTRTYNRQYSPAIGVNIRPGGSPVIVNTNPGENTVEQTDLALTCTVQFEAKNNIVVSTRMSGNGCNSW